MGIIDHDTRLLVICPSRSRPDRIREMIRSFELTRSMGTELLIYLADDDPLLEKYVNLGNHTVVVGPPRTIIEVFNYCSTELHPNVPYYADINDDHIYVTLNWDSKLISEIERLNGWALACPNDQFTDWQRFKHPSAAVIDGNVIRALKHFFHPDLKHLGADTYLGALFFHAGRLSRLEDVVIEHRHLYQDRSLLDETYLRTYGIKHAAEWQRAQEILKQWEKHDLPREVFKIVNGSGTKIKAILLFVKLRVRGRIVSVSRFLSPHLSFLRSMQIVVHLVRKNGLLSVLALLITKFRKSLK